MSKEVLTNFTPVLDVIVKEIGLITAAVYGRVWRYCQGEYEECFASQTTIAKELGLSRKTVNEHLELLVKAGYITETDKAGVTKTYRDTGKVSVDMKIQKATCNPKLQVEPLTCNPKLQPEKAPVTQSYNTCNPELQVPVTQSYTKIDIKKEVKKEELEYESEPDEVFSRMQKTVETLTGRLTTPGDIATIDKFIAEGVIEEDIRSALAWRADQKLRPVANIRQLESGVLRNKAERVQAAAASAAKPAGTAQPAKKETALDRTKAALQKVMAEALLEEERNGKQS